jgi:putative oxidoreductase
MTVVRLVARPLLASMSIAGGLDSVRHADAKADTAAPVAVPLAEALPFPLPADPVQLVRLNGAAQVVAGVMLALGIMPRRAAVVLAATLVPTTLAGHRFWEVEDPKARAQQRIHLLKNASMLGGLLLAAVDTAGKPSLSWRARRGIRRAGRGVGEVGHRVGERAGAAVDALPGH